MCDECHLTLRTNYLQMDEQNKKNERRNFQDVWLKVPEVKEWLVKKWRELKYVWYVHIQSEGHFSPFFKF